MSRPRELENAYASLADRGGIALYCSAAALRELAGVLREGSAEVALAAPPESVLETGPLRTIRAVQVDGALMQLRAKGETMEITGDTATFGKLAATLENLADTPQVEVDVPRHVDIEHFPGHSFLGEDSMWMTVTLLPAQV